MRERRRDQPQLPFQQYGQIGRATPTVVASAFDAARLTQARQLAGLTKRQLAEAVGVTPAAIGQFEAGTSGVRPILIPRLAEALDVPIEFFLFGRPHGKLHASMLHFKSLRSTRNYQREKAMSFAEQVWELTYALEKRVFLPLVDLPGFSGGEVNSGDLLPSEPNAAARALRKYWILGSGPISHLVRHMESNGIIVVYSGSDPDSATVDAYSTSRLPRPVVVLTTNRADDVYRHRFSAAHELGHLILHGDIASGDPQQEREADEFAAEFLTPGESIVEELPSRVDFNRLLLVQRTWGVSIKSLIRRCRELGLISDSSATRAYQRLNILREQPGFRAESVAHFSGEQPAMLSRAFEMAMDDGLKISELAAELAWSIARVRTIIGTAEQRPELRLIVNNQ